MPANKKSGSGAFSEYIQFVRMPNPSDQDTMGAPSSEPAHHFYSYAAFEALGGREFRSNDKRWADSTARFRIPYQKIAINPGLHQIVYTLDPTSSPPNVSTWNILGVHTDRFETIIEVNEVV